MIVEIVGRSVKTPNYVVKKAANFFGDYLLGSRLSQRVSLTIGFEKFKKGCNDYAYCDWSDDNHRARDFIITIDKTLSKRETLLALAHEMVHLKQYAKGEMKDLFRPVRMTRFLGKNYDPDNMDYWELPYEIEAYGREKGLYIKFMSYMKEEDDAV